MKSILERLLDGRHLTGSEAESLMEDIMKGQVPSASLAAMLAALRLKGETVEEITGFALAMRRHLVPVPTRSDMLLDTCGTGGDGSGTVNISTATALVAAAMGIPVAKHGNRAVSSRSGSADVLEALGVNIDLGAEQVGRLVDSVGIGFLFAPNLHPAMKHAAPVRRELKVRTVFNLLGPLTNPAGADRQLLGVYDPELCEPMCRVLANLGARRAYVVHGAGGLDEVSPCGPTRVAELAGGKVRVFEFNPAELGLELVALEDLRGGSPRKNARLLKGVFQGQEGPLATAIALNAAFAAVLGEKAADLATGLELARNALDSGAVLETLDRLMSAGAQLVKEAS
jgi:anthranilate phosphoribosyltransferase